MNQLQVFKNNNFGEIRTTTINDEPYLMLNDVCKVLEIANPRNIKTRLNEKGVVTMDTLTKGGKQQATFINESNLYKVIFQSRKPQAEKFTEWVTSDVLPSIRKTGMYATDELLNNPDLLIEAGRKLKEQKEIIRQQQKAIEEAKPKVLFADSVATSHTSILVGELAKILKGNGIDIGQNRLFSWLRDNGYLISRKGTDRNMPTQKSMELGLFEIKETVVSHADGHTSISKTPKVTGKGQQYFIQKFLGE